MSVFLTWQALVAAVASYLLGCSNGAILVSKYILRDDIRKHGSGNAGLTNFYRTFGGALTLLVILSDVLKAVFAMLIGSALFASLGDPMAGKYLAALCVVLGHMFPFMFRFKGGKGILSGGTVVIMMDWRIALIALGLFIVLAAATKWVSLGSVVAVVAFPIATWFVFYNPVYTGFASVIAALVLWKHRGNIQRILNGTEAKFSIHRRSKT
ncbi:Glycerol-3-phosphate acyltransferase [bioreactor metagenome]|uniref:Glycerol-3-phosphate acyltransferase n=1 Tax=bioreactor metagenome TaxID=1076179 RepID=A0A645BFA0_9ZZZZ